MSNDSIRPIDSDEQLILRHFNNVHRRVFEGKGEGLEVSASSNGLVFFPPGTAHPEFWSCWHSEDGNASLTRRPPIYRHIGSDLHHCILMIKSHITEMLDLSKVLK